MTWRSSCAGKPTSGLARYGMTRAQWAVLARLEREPGITQSQLANLTDVEPITIGRLVDRLEANGLIERTPDPERPPHLAAQAHAEERRPS